MASHRSRMGRACLTHPPPKPAYKCRIWRSYTLSPRFLACSSDNYVTNIVMGRYELLAQSAYEVVFWVKSAFTHQGASDTLQLLSARAARPPRFPVKMIPPFLMSVLKANPISLHISFSSLASPFLLLRVHCLVFPSASSPVSTLLLFLFHPISQSIQPLLCCHFSPTCHGIIILRH